MALVFEPRHASDTHPIDQLAIARVRLASLAIDVTTSQEIRDAIHLLLDRLDEIEALQDPPTTPATPDAKRSSRPPGGT